jgi:hypothetical protein
MPEPGDNGRSDQEIYVAEAQVPEHSRKQDHKWPAPARHEDDGGKLDAEEQELCLDPGEPPEERCDLGDYRRVAEQADPDEAGLHARVRSLQVHLPCGT